MAVRAPHALTPIGSPVPSLQRGSHPLSDREMVEDRAETSQGQAGAFSLHRLRTR